MDDKNLHFAKLSSGWQVQPTRVNIIFEQAEAEVVLSSSLVEVEVEIEVEARVEVEGLIKFMFTKAAEKTFLVSWVGVGGRINWA